MHVSENDAVLISVCEPSNHIHQDTKSARLIAVCKRSITLNKFGKWARGCCVRVFLVYIYDGIYISFNPRLVLVGFWATQHCTFSKFKIIRAARRNETPKISAILHCRQNLIPRLFSTQWRSQEQYCIYRLVLFVTACGGWVLGKRLTKAITKVQKADRQK